MAAPAPDWIVRDAVPDDVAAIVAFNQALAEETESKLLDRDVLSRGVRRALAEPTSRIRYWVAQRDDTILGMSGVTREWSDWRDGWIWWLQSVYVAREARGGGIFRGIYSAIHAAALADPGVIGLRLYVEEANDRAMATYRALGLRPGGYQVFQELWPDRFGQGG